MFNPRPKQFEVLQYQQGYMGVSAVPGSGKTHTLSSLAAELIGRGSLEEDQEILIVTLVNSAVDHFAHRVATFVREKGLLPQIGYRVRTLHGLAHDIARERPELAGLSEGFQILDERETLQILRSAVETWLGEQPHVLDEFISLELDEKQLERVSRRQWPDLVMSLAVSFIRQAKDLRVSANELQERLNHLEPRSPLLEMGTAIYMDYQRALLYRGGVDFDDLIVKALQALQSDPAFLERLRARWPYILEDESQDSSRLQEEILRLLAGPDGNWVRVGDPNQAIFETFTTASPQFLRDFLAAPGVTGRELPNSGRSTMSILSLANALVDWTMNSHPVEDVRQALSLPHIEPTPAGDPQPNPPDDPAGVKLDDLAYTPSEEIKVVCDSLAKWLPDHLNQTVAVLVPSNQRGFQVVAELKRRGVACIELLQSSRSTRETAGALTHLLFHLGDPSAPRHLAKVFLVNYREERENPDRHESLQHGAEILQKCPYVEAYLWPRPGQDWLEDQGLEEEDSALYARLVEFRSIVQRWQRAALLPIDQLILTLSQDLFVEPSDLALAYKLAVLLRRVQDQNPEIDLTALGRELEMIARNERRFLGVGPEDVGFDPEQHKGQVVVSTIHKAKGLEWDRVYLMAVNNYDFPSAMPQDSFIAEKWFLRDQFNLEAETLEQLKLLVVQGNLEGYEEGGASRQARLDYTSERLRLLYVGITRARKELMITWNTGRRGDQQQSVPFIALESYWKTRI